MNINIASDLGGIIRSARKAHGWNQAYLASLVGIHQPDLSDIERDPQKANFGLVLRICAALQLKVSIDHLDKNALDKSDIHKTISMHEEGDIEQQKTWSSTTGKKVNF